MQLSRAKPSNPASVTIHIGECVCLCVCVSFWAYTRRRLGPIRTKFGTRMEIHLEMVMAEIKITPCDLGGIWGGGFRGHKITNLE